MNFPIVSCETLKKAVGPLIFLLKVKGGSMKNIALAAIVMQAMSGMLQCG
ncbi:MULTISPECIES: hypothetical protein [Bacillaceae]|nr:hypothetical protein [Bacillus sp. BA3]